MKMLELREKAALCKAAFEARKMAYAPYSSFLVGAALMGENGRIYTGCNIENASYSATVCAERVALFKAVSEGERQFSALALCGAAQAARPPFAPCIPCGVCLQALAEFCPEDLPVLLTSDGVNCKETTLSDFLPHPFILK